MTLGFGWALLDARTGDNRPHSHIAHQISLALESPCEIKSEHPLQLEQGQAAFIPAGIENCLVPAGVAVRAIYVDPLFRGMRNLIREPAPVRLVSDEAAALGAVRCGEDARQWVSAYRRQSSSSPIDHRLDFDPMRRKSHSERMTVGTRKIDSLGHAKMRGTKGNDSQKHMASLRTVYSLLTTS